MEETRFINDSEFKYLTSRQNAPQSSQIIDYYGRIEIKQIKINGNWCSSEYVFRKHGVIISSINFNDVAEDRGKFMKWRNLKPKTHLLAEQGLNVRGFKLSRKRIIDNIEYPAHPSYGKT